MVEWSPNNSCILCVVAHGTTICCVTKQLLASSPAALQGFAESLQQECSKPAQNVMIELYSRPIVLAPNEEGSWVLGLQGKYSAKPCSFFTHPN